MSSPASQGCASVQHLLSFPVQTDLVGLSVGDIVGTEEGATEGLADGVSDGPANGLFEGGNVTGFCLSTIGRPENEKYA